MENKNIPLITVKTEIGECVLHLGGLGFCARSYGELYVALLTLSGVLDQALPVKIELAHREAK